MTEYIFASKQWFFLLLSVPFIVLWNIFLVKKGKRFIFFSSRSIIPNTGKTMKTFFIKSLVYFKIAAIVLFIIALARPQERNYYEKQSRKGIDIMITLDCSGSMAAEDFRPKNRLNVAKEVISNFIEKRTNDRLGLVIFAGQCYTRCPLTVDFDILKDSLKRTKIGEMEDGTALGMALANAVNRVRQSKGKTKIIILLTDGINNRGEIDPRDAAKIAKDFNIKVYTIGVGTRGKAPYPVTDEFGQIQYMLVDVEIDEELLKEIANNTGGLYYRATDTQQLQQIFTEIDRWEKTEITSRKYSTAKDLYIYFLLAGLVILFLAEFAKRTFLRSLP